MLHLDRGDLLGFRLGIGVWATALAAMMAANPGISSVELSLFRLVNELPASFRVGLSSVMQLGSLSAVPATAGVALWRQARQWQQTSPWRGDSRGLPPRP
jgi:hypothetical protein